MFNCTSQLKTQIKDDWKFIAIVIDRLFLWIFSVTITLGTAMVILSAPTLRDKRLPLTEMKFTVDNVIGDQAAMADNHTHL